jgi:hypothetical protein
MRVMKLRCMKRAKHFAHLGEMINAYRILVGKDHLGQMEIIKKHTRVWTSF